VAMQAPPDWLFNSRSAHPACDTHTHTQAIDSSPPSLLTYTPAAAAAAAVHCCSQPAWDVMLLGVDMTSVMRSPKEEQAVHWVCTNST
jgi:hypothetical protein